MDKFLKLLVIECSTNFEFFIKHDFDFTLKSVSQVTVCFVVVDNFKINKLTEYC